MADAMDKQATDTQPAVLVAIELSRASWLLAVYDPITDKISRRRIAGGDAASLIAVIGEARRRAEHRADGPVGAECVFEAGYDGFWLHRRLMAAGIGCRVMDPASLKVGSAITAWFRAKTAGGGGRAKRVAIVAVARKLAIALWRMATLGIVPEGARLRPAVAAAG